MGNLRFYYLQRVIGD